MIVDYYNIFYSCRRAEEFILPTSLFLTPNGRSELQEVRVEFPFILIDKLAMGFLKGQSRRLSRRVLKSWYLQVGARPAKGFRRCFADGLNQGYLKLGQYGILTKLEVNIACQFSFSVSMDREVEVDKNAERTKPISSFVFQLHSVEYK